MMSKESKYHELLDKLADAIEQGKKSDMIDQIKNRIETIENKLQKMNKERKHKK